MAARRRTAFTSPAAASARRLPLEPSPARPTSPARRPGRPRHGRAWRWTEQLEQAESKGGEHRRSSWSVGRAARQLDQMVGRAASLDRAVREPLRLGSLTSALETVARRRRPGKRDRSTRRARRSGANLVGDAAPGRQSTVRGPAITSLARARRSAAAAGGRAGRRRPPWDAARRLNDADTKHSLATAQPSARPSASSWPGATTPSSAAAAPTPSRSPPSSSR